MKNNITKFRANMDKLRAAYSPEAFTDKIKHAAKKAGKKAVYYALLLYYASLDKDVPAKDRLMIIAALGYFILPADLIPDMVPGGFADDTAALIYVVKKVWNNITPATTEKARAKTARLFSNSPAPDIEGPIAQ